MQCPSCGAAMTVQALEGHLRSPLAIDVCAACQAFWFDRHESVQLSPASTLRLFRLVGEAAPDRRGPLATTMQCPKCRSPLAATTDSQRNVRFRYWRCPEGHGRLTTFYDFLREKNFLRPLSASQVEALRQHVETVNCSNCGAPIDLAKTSACTHCGSALSMLDLKQTQHVISQLQQADRTGKPVDPALPIRLEQARREVEQAFANFEHEPRWYDTVASRGVLGASLSALSRWLQSRG